MALTSQWSAFAHQFRTGLLIAVASYAAHAHVLLLRLLPDLHPAAAAQASSHCATDAFKRVPACHSHDSTLGPSPIGVVATSAKVSQWSFRIMGNECKMYGWHAISACWASIRDAIAACVIAAKEQVKMKQLLVSSAAVMATVSAVVHVVCCLGRRWGGVDWRFSPPWRGGLAAHWRTFPSRQLCAV
jgi:hypothetical protein